MRALLAIMMLAGATQLSCSVNDYCLNCGTGDGGMGSGDDANDGGGSGSDDGGDGGGCIPTGLEVCNNKDDNCNGLVDDAVTDVGDLCPEQRGACMGDVTICNAMGVEVCDSSASGETCNAADDNCNGMIDEGDPGGGAKCGTDQGECIAGQMRCNAATGMLQCMGFVDHTMDPELCDAKDNDCDGNFDENVVFNPATCGPMTNDGECNMGTFSCSGGSQQCMGAVFPKFETCNNLDDDCDTNTDEIFNKMTDVQNCGMCGMVCQPTSKTCINTNNMTNGATCTMDSQCPGGTCATNSQPRCMGGGCTFACTAGFQNLDGMAANGCEYRCFSSGAEACDGVDNDCDGNIDESLTPPAICLSGGECGATAPVAQCNGAAGWSCSYPGNVQFPNETRCDGLNNDCDANTDEGQPNLNQACDQVPETMCGAAGDEDNDGANNDGCPTVGMGPETLLQCTDAVDSDGDGAVNDGCPAVAERGVCRSTGTFQCDAMNLDGPAKCVITNPGQMPDPMETCDARDNDCDGNTDEGGASGNLIGQEWVDVGGGIEMMKYEASKPDASAANAGSTTSIACSRTGVVPWTNVTYPQAQAACQAIGATLCNENTWHRTCSAVTPVTWPITAAAGGTLFEAEDYFSSGFGITNLTPEAVCNNAADDDGDGWINDGCANVGAAETTQQCAGNKDEDNDGTVNDGCAARGPTKAWVPDYTAGFSGIAALEATPNTGISITAAQAVAQGSRVDYQINFPAAATYVIWLKMFANSGNDNRVHVGLSNLAPPQTATSQVTLGTNNAWTWISAGSFNVPAAGDRFLSVYMGRDGVKVDQIYLVVGAGTPPNTINSGGGTWAYTTTPNIYQPNTCNGDDYDTDGSMPMDQDDIIAAGSLANCQSTVGGGVFDMSGNVKEWTLAHAPGENPIRGGASNNTPVGISCALNFTLADDAFFFPNIGFRCCR
jgi:hypothetical protein